MSSKPRSDEYKAFEHLLGKVLTVTKTELNERLKKEAQQKHPPATPDQHKDKPAHC